MFNDRHGLTAAVLSGRKTQTRRNSCRYKVGEMVAIAQSYKDAGVRFVQEEDKEFGCYDFPAEQTKGWNNKMFVKADLMPHHIRITSMHQERLQDISREDCLKEGIYFDKEGGKSIGYPFAVPFYYTFRGAINHDGKQLHWSTHKDAFASLIDKVSGKGTWASNPMVWVYDFELVD